MRYALLVLVFSASTASAQTVETTLDMPSLGWGPLMAPQSIETDGDLTTFEWLIRRPFSTEMRVVAERNGGICAGPWFRPTHRFQPIDVQRRGLLHIVVVTDDDHTAKIVRLDTPVCEP